ncbi:hypothetical protein NST38_31495 [Paenibacillus sp. FSL H8-0104]|uniref:hypothetical protein n=1 Tax=Paenibacillus sp. FSL H8-0104 TaxID=2954509 RepID=UPI0030FDD0E3
MAIKGQKFKTYSEKIKQGAIRLHTVEVWTYRKIKKHLNYFQMENLLKIFHFLRE